MAKCYYCFLGAYTNHYSKYKVYADQLFNDYAKTTNTINYLLNRKRKQDWGKKGRNIFSHREVNSKHCDLVQLIDVLMGVYKATNCTKETKLKLSRYVQSSFLNISTTRFSIDLFGNVQFATLL